MIPVIIIGGILSGYYTPTESASVALAVTVVLAVAFADCRCGFSGARWSSRRSRPAS